MVFWKFSRNNKYVSIPGKLSEVHLQSSLFSNQCGKVLSIVGISWSPDLRVQHTSLLGQTSYVWNSYDQLICLRLYLYFVKTACNCWILNFVCVGFIDCRYFSFLLFLCLCFFCSFWEHLFHFYQSFSFSYKVKLRLVLLTCGFSHS